MDFDPLHIDQTVRLDRGRMVLAFTGWMDGGNVSTGTVLRLVDQLQAESFARIDPESFYLYNFPGAMEITAMFRPHIRIEDGIIQLYQPPDNTFYFDRDNQLVLFVGKEPNLNWQTFGRCILHLVEQTGIQRIYFVGSFGGSVPHTREPRLYATVSDPAMLETLQHFNVQPSRYEGPASFTSYLMTLAARRNLEMATLVAEIPGYLEGVNPMSIEAVTRRLALILGLSLDLAPMRVASDEWELRVSEEVAKNDDLAQQVRQLEQQYDDQLIGIQPDPEGADDDEDSDDDDPTP